MTRTVTDKKRSQQLKELGLLIDDSGKAYCSYCGQQGHTTDLCQSKASVAEAASEKGVLGEYQELLSTVRVH